MSRIIVKQLPKNITEEKLKNLFGGKGAITDIQLKYTPDGKFRQFCFIGYRNDEDAQEAIKFFNNSCIQTSRVKVELCATLGGVEKPKAWSKYAKDSKPNEVKSTELNDEKQKKKDSKKLSMVDEIIGNHMDDPEFKEFMKVHDKNRLLWGNDADIDETQKSEEIGKETSEEQLNKVRDAVEDECEENEGDTKLAEKPISDLEYMKSLISTSKDNKSVKGNTQKNRIDLFTIKMHNIPYKIKRQDILKFFKPLKPYSVRLPTNVNGFCYIGFKTEKDMAKAMLKSKSFINGKQVFFTDFTEKNKIAKAKIDGNESTVITPQATKHSKWAKQEENMRNEENISESGKIFFRNLAYTVTEDDLQQVFEKFGPVAEINLPVDYVTRQIKGFGTVTYVMPEHAVQAFNKLDGSIFHGRLFHLIPGKSNDDNEIDENDASLSFKEKKAIKLKTMANNSITWNTLFLGANAVAEILAKKFDTSKEKILDTSDGGSSAAVRIALGETQIVLEMKQFLEDNGVCLSAFESSSVKRSKTIILAKNLPADTSVAELMPLFAKFGPIGRIVLPPSGVTALIDFCDSSEARKAFKKLAYSKFKNLPLYLEWAPENTFKTKLNGEPQIPKQESVIEAKTEDMKLETEANTTLELKTSENVAHEKTDEPPENNTTLFLRNLNFKTEQDTVYKHFKHLGSIHTVEIAKRRNPDDPRNPVSLGYGFIQFKKEKTANTALKQMQLTNIDDKQIELKRSDRILKTNAQSVTHRKNTIHSEQNGTKILVRNIPFQAKTKEVRDIFKAFGELRSLRLPLKMTPGEDSHRGFGFVDFITKSDAKKAFEAICQSTHLYGRKLILEWASTSDEDVGELRKRTAQQYQTTDKSAKCSKKGVFDVEANINTVAKGEDEESNS